MVPISCIVHKNIFMFCVHCAFYQINIWCLKSWCPMWYASYDGTFYFDPWASGDRQLTNRNWHTYGQHCLNPPDVFFRPEYEIWLESSIITSRERYARKVIQFTVQRGNNLRWPTSIENIIPLNLAWRNRSKHLLTFETIWNLLWSNKVVSNLSIFRHLPHPHHGKFK